MTASNKPSRLAKSDFLKHWAKLRPQPIQPKPVSNAHQGSSYGEDGIRITGSRKFVDSVLSRLTDLLAFENGCTRLDVNYTEQAARIKTGEGVQFGGPTGDWVCYIKVAERGPEAQMVNALLGIGS